MCAVLRNVDHGSSIHANCQVLVMEQGKVVEFDSPKNLLRNPTSYFNGTRAWWMLLWELEGGAHNNLLGVH